jgi:uncharacterized GH25 family protein
MKRRSGKRILEALVVTVSFCSILTLGYNLASAHDLWISAEQPQKGKPLHILVGWGHGFPDTEQIKMEDFEPAFVVGPGGRIETKTGDKQDYLSVAPVADGSYVVAGARKAQFRTKTTEGYKPLPKNQVQGAESCSYSVKFAKSIVNVGNAHGDVSKPVGQTFELVPLVNPADVKPGGVLPVQILYDGNPLPKTQVFATFAGFSKDSGSYAFAGRSDKDGKVNLQVWSAGQWLLLAKHELDHPNPNECDKLSYGAALTFAIVK